MPYTILAMTTLNVTLKYDNVHRWDSCRDWYNLGTMFCCHHSRYELGDKQFSNWDELQDAMMREYLKGKDLEAWCRFYDGDTEDADWAKATKGVEKDKQLEAYWKFCAKRKARFWDLLDKYAIVLPLYLYEHSGITMNTTGFSCRWDSGQVGMIAVSRETVRNEWKVKRIGPKLEKKIREYLRGEVEAYDMELRGDVYYYCIETEDGELIDSCGGCYGDDHFIEEVKSAIERYLKNHQVAEIKYTGDAAYLTDYYDLPQANAA